MSGISQVLETARRALLAQQYGLSVTGHNIANVSTPGYSRQRAEFVTTSPSQTAAGLLGTGVMVESVSRLRNRFIDQQIRSSNDSLSLASAEYQILSQIEATFNEPSDSGMSGVLNSFFQSWHDLSTNPEDPVSRNDLMLKGKQVTDTFHRLNAEMSSLRNSLRDEITTKLDRINTLTTEISKLNVDITAATVGGLNPSDMQDLRDAKLEELSTLANIQVHEDSRGSVMVVLGGAVIADNGASLPLRLEPAPPATVSGSSFDQLRIVSGLGNEVKLTGGEAGGLLKSYNTTIPDALGRLDRLAEGIVAEVNRYHATGYGLQNPPATGINFFMGNSAATIGLDLTDTSGGAAAGSAPSIDNIAASASATAPGNNEIALLIAEALNRKPVTDGGGATLLDGLSLLQYYNQSVTRIGSAVNSADTMIQSQELVLDQLTTQRESVSGVSLDEEMTDMIKFQRAFDAAARMVNTADEMFQTLLNMV
ncbi:MAG: flagellar hook-associated protein FlgK [Bacteroidetes bacterium]|nr:flagellar hook-associated protein FlgK [Bacteroidota bacterium]